MPKSAQPVYVKPVKGSFQRVDEGVDYKGTPGDHVVAIGRARIDYVKDNPGGFGKVIYYTLLDGPNAGQQIYVGHARPDVKSGQTIAMGQSVATLLQHPLGSATQPGWVEIGFASGGRPTATSDVGQGVPGTPGSKFLDFVNGLDGAAPPTTGGGIPPTDVTGATGPGLVDTAPAHPADIQPNRGASTGDVGGSQEQLANLWQQIANQQFASPETRMMAQNAQTSLPSNAG